jgi:PPOX class probable FMN-dependent enzyme
MSSEKQMLEDSWLKKLNHSLSLTNGQPESRFLQFATLDEHGNPQNRTLVFRRFNDKNELILYSDSRSAKANELNVNPYVAICWYFAETREQYRISGTASTVIDKTIRENAWQSLSENSKAQYLWGTPGSTKLPDSKLTIDAESDLKEPPKHFWVISVTASKVDYLTLFGEPQSRVCYTQKEGTWSEEHLIP